MRTKWRFFVPKLINYRIDTGHDFVGVLHSNTAGICLPLLVYPFVSNITRNVVDEFFYVFNSAIEGFSRISRN